MHTPAGKECSFFYGDYYRGRSHEECRLLTDNGLTWRPYMCGKCPIPDIIRANACKNMHFIPELARPLLIVGKPGVSITVECVKHSKIVNEPMIGCGHCQSLPEIFVAGTDDFNPTS